MLICRALARGQGKTEGLHERRIVVPPKAVGYWRSHTLRAAGPSRAGSYRARRQDARSVALRSDDAVPERTGANQFQAAPQTIRRSRTAHSLIVFEAEIDRDFFERLFEEIEIGGDTDESIAAQRCQHASTGSSTYASERKRFSRTAEAGSPTSAVRHHRAWVRAERAFEAAFLRGLP